MATDPTKVTAGDEQPADDEQPQPDADRALTEPDAQGDAPKDGEPAYVLEIRKELADTREAARRAQGSSDRNTARLEKQVSRLEALLTRALTANMSDDERRAFEKDAELERLREQQGQAKPADQEALREWQAFASRALEKAGIKHDDADLVAAFRKHADGSENPDDWQVALVAAIADVKDNQAAKVKDAATREREDQERKARNGRRAAEGRVDRGAPSGGARKSIREMSDEEFDKHWEGMKAGAREREAQSAAHRQ